MPPDSCFPAACGCLAALVAAAAAGGGALLVRGSTAVPAAWWAVGASLAAAGEFAWQAVGGLDDAAGRSSVRLGVVALSTCPIMAILGAKRPQHGMWQFIVATLAMVLVLPALSAAVVRPGTPPDVHLLERGFILVLLLVGWLNFAATRHGLAATLVSGGQIVWCRNVLPLAGQESEAAAWYDLAAAVAIAGGAVAAVVQSAVVAGRRRARLRAIHEDGGAVHASLGGRVEPAFFALRETLGAAWTLRIAERFNAVASERGWSWRLRFSGLVATGPGKTNSGEDEAEQRAAERTLGGLMRRFVTASWLARHGWP